MIYQDIKKLVKIKLVSGEEFTGYIVEKFPHGLWFRRSGYLSWFSNEIIQEVK